MNRDLVSIIMPTYNRAHIILRSIKSVLKQTYDNFELIIIDDGSTDQTESIISDLDDQRIRYLKSVANQGACHARNRGIATANGEYIAFLDSDNIWDKSYLKSRLSLLKNVQKTVGGVFGYTRVVRNYQTICTVPLEEIGKKIKGSKSNNSLLRYMLFDNIIDTNTIVMKRECIEQVSGFDENLKRLQDWEYFFRVLYQSGYRLQFEEDCLVKNYLHADSITHKSNDEAYWRTRIFFLKKYREVFEDYDCLEEAVCRLCMKKEPHLREEDLSEILEILDLAALQKVIAFMKKEHEKVIRQKDKLALKECAFAKINEKNNLILDIQSRWLKLLQQGNSLRYTIIKMGYKKIAIYGYGYLGKALYRELAESECRVIYIIDRNLAQNHAETLEPGVETPGIEAVVVTAVYEYEKIRKRYERKIQYISLLDVIKFAEKEKIFR